MERKYKILTIKGNKKTKSGDQIESWTTPTVDKLLKQMDEWDWNKTFEFEMPEKPLVSIFEEALWGDKLPAKLPEKIKLFLYKSSKLTDFINGTFLEQYGIIVSEKAKEILEQFNIGKFKFYPLTVVQNEIEYDNYYFFKCLTNSSKFIDIEKSSYIEEDFSNPNENKKLSFKNIKEIEEYNKYNDEPHKYMFADEIQLSDEFPDYDYFTISEFGVYKKFVSNKLADSFKNLTGVILTENTIIN